MTAAEINIRLTEIREKLAALDTGIQEVNALLEDRRRLADEIEAQIRKMERAVKG